MRSTSSYRLYVDRMSEGLQPFVILSLDDEQLQYCTRNANKLVNVWIVLADLRIGTSFAPSKIRVSIRGYSTTMMPCLHGLVLFGTVQHDEMIADQKKPHLSLAPNGSCRVTTFLLLPGPQHKRRRSQNPYRIACYQE